MALAMKASSKVVLALLVGLFFNYYAGPRWSAWSETISAIAFTLGACFLAALGLSGAMRGPGTKLAVIAFALSCLPGPFMHGFRGPEIGALLVAGLFSTLPAIAGGLAGLALQRFNLRPWWFLAAGVVAIGLVAIGPPK